MLLGESPFSHISNKICNSNDLCYTLCYVVAAVDLRGRVTTLTGSSAAAALGAGACALLLEWGIVRGNVPAMDSITIQRYLIRGANRLNIFDYPNKTWGYGSLDLYDAFRSV